MIKATKGAVVKLVKSSGGVFEVFKDGERIFSKQELGRFPNSDKEVLDELE